ncbi:GTPase [Candidatus Vondammii sp. HM_W22]|uniref:GTPase n=1 Tax=Candidatus Vondammii sp. HM_W22 TaxID=2687299 RepID=UPI001F13C2A1|nr:GTPase [Candidatus Vondammii sp. HM_W22]
MLKFQLPRTLIALVIGLLFLLLVVLLLLATDIAFRVWGHLEQAPVWFNFIYAAGIGILGIPFVIWIWRLLSRSKQIKRESPEPKPQNEEALKQRLQEAQELGVDAGVAESTLTTLQQDREAGIIRVSLFGEISSGKSALAGALIPGATTSSDVLGGTTRTMVEHHWTSPAGNELILVDMPGLNEAGEKLSDLAREEALRSHIVIYLCDGDLTRGQHRELHALLSLHKPTILALNKTDRLQPGELIQLRERLGERAEQINTFVAIRTGGEQQVVRVSPDGSETLESRPLPPQLDELRAALQQIIDSDQGMLDQLRNNSLFVLISRQLDQAEAIHRREQAQQLVNGYAKKAMIGALAAVTPGTDLVIQGYLGTRLIRELTELYKVPLRRIDSETLIELAQKHLGKKHTLVLALAGNAMKAFPGVGTLTGGLLHAAAYGMIFDSLGRAVADSLERRGELHPLPTASLFEEYLGEDLESTAQRIAQVVAAEAKKKSTDS